MMTEPISVTALNQYVKGLLDRDRLLSQVLVRSEISNYKVYPSGHHYFSLKDAESSIRSRDVSPGGGVAALPSGKWDEGGGLPAGWLCFPGTGCINSTATT